MSLDQAVIELQTNVAVIRTHLDNHVAAMTEDLRNLREDIRDLRNKIERLGVVMNHPHPMTNGRIGDWKTVALMISGWTFGLLMLVLEFLLKR